MNYKLSGKTDKIYIYLDLIAIIVIIKLIINRKITTIINDATVQNPATSPQIINIQIIVTMKNKFQLKSKD